MKFRLIIANHIIPIQLLLKRRKKINGKKKRKKSDENKNLLFTTFTIEKIMLQSLVMICRRPWGAVPLGRCRYMFPLSLIGGMLPLRAGAPIQLVMTSRILMFWSLVFCFFLGFFHNNE